MIKEGIYTDLSNEAYHGDKGSISRSALIDFQKSAYTYWANYLNPDRPAKEKTPQMEFGSAFHTLILEPHLFDKQWFVMPEKVYKKDNPKLYEENKKLEEEAEKTSKQVLSQSDYQRLCEMRDITFRNGTAKALIEGAIYESSYFWQDEHSGLMLKCRPDILHDNMIVDLKTCTDASERAIQYELFKYGYDIQMAMCRDGIYQLENNKILNYILICVENKYPFNIGIYTLDIEIIENAHFKYKNFLLKMKESKQLNKWEDYGIKKLYLPKWEIK